MNQGGEPAHDDYGLPPVDIEIPDDARELDRDVQAYHRELRALRRQERSRRWRAPLRRSGKIVPLMAGCLILAMVAGMVLTMFSANPYFTGITGQERLPSPGARATTGSTSPSGTRSAGPASIGPSGATGPAQVAQLPLGTISVAGQHVALRGLSHVALAIVPAKCRCATAIDNLLMQAKLANVAVYLVGRQGVKLRTLDPSAQSAAMLASDDSGVLSRRFRQAGLVVVLVDDHRGVSVEPPLKPSFNLEPQLLALGRAH